MGDLLIDGVLLDVPRIIPHPKGDILRVVRRDEPGFASFGEAYFSTIVRGEVKAWKRHRCMTLNLVVPVGRIRFALVDGRAGSRTEGAAMSVDLGRDDYRRLTIPPGLWMGFSGLGEGLNLLLNVASLIHDPDEVDRAEPDRFKFPG